MIIHYPVRRAAEEINPFLIIRVLDSGGKHGKCTESADGESLTYIDRLATFLGYPRGLVQVMAARLHEARVWESDEVRSEIWFDPQKGGMAFLLDLMVAEGQLIRRWSEEDKQFAYRESDIRAVSHFAI